jgi:ankyrin repeat protein
MRRDAGVRCVPLEAPGGREVGNVMRVCTDCVPAEIKGGGMERAMAAHVWRRLMRFWTFVKIAARSDGRRLVASAVAVLLATVTPAYVSAQVAPTAAEAAQYAGLHAAAHRGDLAEMQRLIAAGAKLDARDRRGRTALHVAAFAKQRDAIRLLANARADLGALENDRYDAVTIAAVADDEETLRVLLSLGASARLITSRYDGTALIAAAHLGHAGVVKQLIAAGAPLDHVNNLHWTAVIESIVLGDGGKRHQQTLQALVDAGANLRLADRQGRTPLTLARSRGYAEIVRILERGLREQG